MSTRVEANITELKGAAKAHRHQARKLADAGAASPSRSAVLLRLYGVESGMKAQYLMQERLRTTRDIPNGTFGDNGHDLHCGFIRLRVPAVVARRPPALHKRSNGEEVPIERSHEALRYGTDLRRRDFDDLDTWLCQILDWLDEKGAA